MNDIVRKLEELNPLETKFTENISRRERAALEELKNDQRIIIKEADKGGALVIMHTDFYRDEMVLQDHLNDVNTYAKVDENADKTTMQNLKILI